MLPPPPIIVTIATAVPDATNSRPRGCRCVLPQPSIILIILAVTVPVFTNSLHRGCHCALPPPPIIVTIAATVPDVTNSRPSPPRLPPRVAAPTPHPCHDCLRDPRRRQQSHVAGCRCVLPPPPNIVTIATAVPDATNSRPRGCRCVLPQPSIILIILAVAVPDATISFSRGCRCALPPPPIIVTIDAAVPDATNSRLFQITFGTFQFFCPDFHFMNPMPPPSHLISFLFLCFYSCAISITCLMFYY